MKKFVDPELSIDIDQQKKQFITSKTSRQLLTILHRWAGLLLATFLFISGLTGAIISWDHELDEWLNPHLFDRQTQG